MHLLIFVLFVITVNIWYFSFSFIVTVIVFMLFPLLSLYKAILLTKNFIIYYVSYSVNCSLWNDDNRVNYLLCFVFTIIWRVHHRLSKRENQWKSVLHSRTCCRERNRYRSCLLVMAASSSAAVYGIIAYRSTVAIRGRGIRWCASSISQ
jgi:hypothetical protein